MVSTPFQGRDRRTLNSHRCRRRASAALLRALTIHSPTGGLLTTARLNSDGSPSVGGGKSLEAETGRADHPPTGVASAPAAALGAPAGVLAALRGEGCTLTLSTDARGQRELIITGDGIPPTLLGAAKRHRLGLISLLGDPAASPARRHDVTSVDRDCLGRANHGEGGDATTRGDRDTGTQTETAMEHHDADDPPSRSEFGNRTGGGMESGLKATRLDKQAAEYLYRPVVNEFSIRLYQCDDAWTAGASRSPTLASIVKPLAERLPKLSRKLRAR